MFVVCGEALIDVFASGDTTAGMALDARVGGSPFNAAVGLARLGQPVVFLGSISNDFLGERLMRTLVAEGVDTRAIWRSDARTTLGLVGVDAQGVPSYAFYGEGGADRQLPLGALDALPDGVRAVLFGSYAMVVEPAASTLRALVDRMRARALIAYDPNIRLNVEPDLTLWRDRFAWMLPRSDVLKISEEDLALLQPGVALDDFAAAALKSGPALVVVTRGAEGATGWTTRTKARVDAPQVDVVDTVGAGDTFQAALLTWLSEHDLLSGPKLAAMSGEIMERALTFATLAAAVACSRRGADVPRRSELRG